VHVPLDHFFEVLPKMQPRMYSISSSPNVHKDTVHITAIVQEWTSPIGMSEELSGAIGRWWNDVEFKRILVLVLVLVFFLPFILLNCSLCRPAHQGCDDDVVCPPEAPLGRRTGRRVWNARETVWMVGWLVGWLFVCLSNFLVVCLFVS
jgi:hypothetical protein